MTKIQNPPFLHDDPIFIEGSFYDGKAYYSNKNGHFLKVRTSKYTGKTGYLAYRVKEVWYKLTDAEWEEINIEKCGYLKWL